MLLVLFLVMGAGSASAGQALSGTPAQPVDIQVLESNDARVVIQYTLAGYNLTPVNINKRECITLSLPGAVQEKFRGMPELPKVNRGIIIPDQSHMSYRILDAEYASLRGVTVMPSKGHIERNVNPADVPFEFSRFYEEDAWYPENTVRLHDPYIIRDFRGLVVQFNPFRFNPALATVEVCERLVVEVYADGPGRLNVKNRRDESISGAFVPAYERRFINYGMQAGRYTHVAEPGRLCIVVYDAWQSNVQPLADWKNKKGIETLLVTKTAAGSTASGIKSYLQSLYNSADGLTYAILVGDVNEIPYFSGGYNGAPCDSIYARLDGGDFYPDIYISRISAQSAAQVNDQVDKFLTYERYPSTTATWYHEGVGIASNEGYPTDAERMDDQFNQLEGYGFTNTCKQYEGAGGTTSGITSCINDGRSIVGYYGHGSGTSWTSVYFSTSDVSALTNQNELPWIFEASCTNGDYTISTCFGESWLRATSGGEPSGAIACYMGTTTQSWDPPVYGSEEAVDLFTAEEKNSCGGLYYGGSMYVVDLYPGSGTEGEKYMDQCILFGDASLQVRSKAAVTPAVNHPPSVPLAPSTVTVTVSAGGPFEGALVCLSQPGYFQVSGLTDVTGQVMLDIAPGSADLIDITVTGYNLLPYESTIQPISDGAYVTYVSHAYDDDMSGGSYGNGDGDVTPGETVELELTLKNFGNADADNVTVTLSSTDAYITFIDDTADYGTVTAGSTEVNPDPLVFTVDLAATNGYVIPVHGVVQNGRADVAFDFSIPVVGPILEYSDAVIDDAPIGNNDGDVDMGETITLEIDLTNRGNLDLTGVSAVITTDDPSYVTILEDTAFFPDIGAGATQTSLSPHYSFTVDLSTPCGEILDFNITVTTEQGIITDAFDVLVGGLGVGFSDDMESGEGDWTHFAGWGTDDWAIITSNYAHSPTHCWRSTDVGSVKDDYLITPAFSVTALSELTFWHRYDLEDGYDGAVIEITTNGSTWTDLGTYITQGGYNDTISTSFSNPIGGRPAWSGYSGNTMSEVVVDLSAFIGATAAKVRFRLGCDSSVSADGWYVDDVEILGAECQPYSGPTYIELTNPGVTPGSGYYGTRFVFTVDYYNIDGYAPTVMQLNLDGDFYDMTLDSGTPENGTYLYATRDISQDDAHEFYFYAEDGVGVSVRAPAGDTIRGPSTNDPVMVLTGDAAPGAWMTVEVWGAADALWGAAWSNQNGPFYLPASGLTYDVGPGNLHLVKKMAADPLHLDDFGYAFKDFQLPGSMGSGTKYIQATTKRNAYWAKTNFTTFVINP
jgi:uncharacterized repeat protein (TIGR01451 family)